MKTFRLDLHVHTRISPDGLDAPENVVAAARRAGLDGIAITDHDRRGGYDRLVKLGLADPSGNPVDGFLVIPGVEVSTREGHVLVIGAAWNTGPGIAAELVVRRARAEGALAIAAHPFDRLRSGVGGAVLDRVGFDAVEGCNSKSVERRSNPCATAYAREHNLPCVGGSDAHTASTVGRAHTVVHAEELTVRSVIDAIRAGRADVSEGKHSLWEVTAYWVRGWFTRPWVAELAGRAACRIVRRTGVAEFMARMDDIAGAEGGEDGVVAVGRG